MANEQLTLDFFDDLPEKPDAEQIARITLKNWREHLKAVGLLESQITKLIDEAVKEAARLGKRIKPEDIGRAFSKNPTLKKSLYGTMQHLAEDLTAAIEQGSKDAWLRSNNTGNAIIAQMAAGNATLAALLQSQQNKPQNDRALVSFQKREVNGMNLSERVWKLVGDAQRDMERAVEVALAEGTPAEKLSQRVRELLQEPHRLYRRVRDKDGNLRLSQAAQQYHPGRGVYRSSYKNAMRLARTEVNMAYHAADNERWQNSWWVRGIRIWLSNNHTIKDSKGHPVPLVDICDELMGDYPADFKFTGWHPQCRCIATAITCSYEDIRDFYRRKRAGEDMTGYTPPGTIKEPPAAFKNWLSTNADRLAGAAERGTTPYFIRDNAKYTGAKAQTPTQPQPQQAPPKKTIAEIAAERHATRDAADIQNRATIRQARIAIESPWMPATEKAKLQKIYNDATLSNAQKAEQLKTTSEDIAYKSFMHTMVPAANRYAKESPTIASLQQRWTGATDPVHALALGMQLKEKCAIKTRWDLRRWGATDRTTAFERSHPDYSIYKGRTLTEPKTGTKVKTEDLTQDLLEFKDKNGISYYYPIGMTRTEIPISAATASKEIASLPQYMRDNFKGVILTNKPHPLDEYYKVAYTNFPRGAMYSGEPITVHVKYSAKDFREAISHEIGHHIDTKLGWRLNATAQKEWTEAVTKDGGYPTTYAKQNSVEDFAESMSDYVNHPRRFKKNFPNRHAQLEKWLKRL